MNRSHEQEVVRDSTTGRYESEVNGPEDYVTTESHLSPWMKEWIKVGRMAEGAALLARVADQTAVLNEAAVQAVIHIQELKR